MQHVSRRPADRSHNEEIKESVNAPSAPRHHLPSMFISANRAYDAYSTTLFLGLGPVQLRSRSPGAGND